MAGDWIQMRCDLADDPRVIQLAAGLNISVDLAVGLLHRFWSWVDRHSVAGRLRGVTAIMIDQIVGRTDFAKNLQHIHWLRVTSAGCVVPKFDRYMAQSAKRRALTARRVGLHREETA